jgi:pSer/pThr/pTyr-binding forkhead associated (FHA) protein
MEEPTRKIILIQQAGPEQEFELGKSKIVIGRAMTSDIILSDARVSRSHARLECGPDGCTLVDLGSSNGSRVNGIRVEQAKLNPGDRIALGNSQLRYEESQPFEEPAMTMIENEVDLETRIDQDVLPMTIHETSQPRLVIFTGDKTWEVLLGEVDHLTIGRTDENDLPLTHPKVSRRHAEIRRKGDIFLIKDLGSTNGTWQKEQRIDELFLQDGDVLHIGAAQLVYKSGFQAQNLTYINEALHSTPKRKPVVFVPGFMGSELWLGNERVWPNVKFLFKNPEIFTYPSNYPLEARNIVDEVVIVPNLVKLDQYNRLGDYLVEDLGYERGVDFFEFAYDWRQDVRLSASQLADMILNLPISEPLTVIGHSLGTMVSRYYIECLGGKERVERVVLMGGPHSGVVKAATSLLLEADLLPFGFLGERMRKVLSSFPSSYQILPVYSCASDQNGNRINFLKDETWVEDQQLPLLRAARQFRQEMGKRSSIPAISIFGYGKKTITRITLQRTETGKLKDIVYHSESSGDSTILEKSAVLEGTEIHPVQQYHGALFVDNDVKMRLKMELAQRNA